MLLVVPSDPLAPRRPDEHFAPEHAAALTLSIEVALVDHDALVAGDAGRGVTRLGEHPDVVYRGWMLGADRYAAFARAAEEQGAQLRTSAAAFATAHQLPGWIDHLRDWTAETIVTTSDSLDDLVAAAARLGSGAAVLRDHVKSAKHHWDEAVHLPDVTDAERVRTVGARLRELRGDDFTGGFVVRRFEDYVSDEFRTWWVDGRGALVTAHPDTPHAPPGPVELPSGLADAVASLGLAFVTVDLARRSDGAWRVIELGDGQVSDRPATTDPLDLLSALDRP